MEGFSYTIKDNILTPITPALYGLSTLISSDNILLTYYNQGAYTSSALRTDDNNTRPLPLLTLKEKCTFDAFSSYFVWCGAPIESPSSTFVEDWYKGIIISDDSIWLVNTNSQTAQLYTNPQQIVGRSLDIQNMTINTQGTFLAFTNKKDSTLWLYDLASEQ